MVAQQGNIAEYTSPVDQLHPSSEGSSALAAAGIHVGRLYNEAGADIKQGVGELGQAVEQHDYMTEVSKGAATGSAILNNKMTEWQQMVSKPGAADDKSIQGKFLDNNLEPELEKFQSGFDTEQGQKWAMDYANKIREHFATTTSADLMNLQGEERGHDVVTQRNQFGSILQKDPTSFDTVAPLWKSYIDGMRNDPAFASTDGKIKLDKMFNEGNDEFAKEQVKAFADQGKIEHARVALEAQGKAGNIEPNWNSELTLYINNQKNAHELERLQRVKISDAQKEQQNSQEVNNAFQSIASGKGATATVIMGNTKLTSAQKTDFLDKKTGILTLPQKFLTSQTYGDNFSQIVQSVYSGQDISGAGLTEGVRRMEITPAGAAQLKAIADKMKTPAGLAEARAQQSVLARMQDDMVKGGSINIDPEGKKIYNNMLNSFYPAWDAEIRSGKTPAQISNPDSKDYIGNLANTFKRSDVQTMADILNTRPTPSGITLGTQQPTRSAQPTQKDVDYLRLHPALADAYDKQYGKGAAEKVIKNGQ